MHDDGVLSVAAEFKFAADDAAKGSFSGYASTFNNVDLGGDVVMPGAFAASLREKKAADIPMLWGHDMRGIPVGKWTHFEEDMRGLKVAGQLTLEIGKARDVYAAMKDGTVKGLSIGYRVAKDGAEWDDQRRIRRLKAVDLIEVSVVTLPMNPRAKVAGIKAAEEIKTIREFEDFLRDVGGYSHAAAKAIAAGGFKAKSDPRDEDGAEIAAVLRRNIATLTR